jgi:hypothetical protein
MDPKKGPKVLSQQEAAHQRAAASALKSFKSQSPRPQTPTEYSSEEDDPNGSDMIWSASRGTFRKNKAKVLSNSDAGNSIASSRQPTPVPSDTEDQDDKGPEEVRPIRKEDVRRSCPKDAVGPI